MVVAADQAGNADYAPATQVTQTMVVNQATPTNYSYTVGYDPVGNVANFNDSVMGTWSFNYDSLNRLMSGQNTAVTSTSTQYTGMNLCWAYDSFGNRIMQIFQSAACPAAPTPGQSPATVYYNPNNQVTFVSQSAPSAISAPNGFAYDGAGNVLQDNQNTYLYDAEGRICAVQSTPVEGFTSMTQYLYDADGTRVAKGTITNWSAGCDTTQNGFTMTASYILGPGNEQLAELSWSGGVPTPVHTNVWAGGQLTATYSYDDPINYPAGILYFPLTDWLPGSPATGLRRWGGLGTRRMLAATACPSETENPARPRQPNTSSPAKNEIPNQETTTSGPATIAVRWAGSCPPIGARKKSRYPTRSSTIRKRSTCTTTCETIRSVASMQMGMIGWTPSSMRAGSLKASNRALRVAWLVRLEQVILQPL